MAVSSHRRSSINSDTTGTLETSTDRLRNDSPRHDVGDAPENTIQTEPLPSQEHDQFARQLGFESYLALFEASAPLKTSTEGKWLLTVLGNDQWVVWNAADLQVAGTYRSEEEAKRSLEG